jgi:DNA-binding CsgD family transcriptional regulator
MIKRDKQLILLNQTIAYKKLDLTFVNFTDNLLAVDGITNENTILGKRDDELPWHVYSSQYHEHDRDALAGKAYTTLVPFGNDTNSAAYVMCNRTKCQLDDGATGIYINVIPLADIYLQAAINDLQKSDPQLNNHYSINKNPANINLTSKELEALFYVLRGKSAKFIADAMNISIRTAEFHIDNIKIKFTCRSKNELICNAINQGYMSVLPKNISAKNLYDRIKKH